MSEFGEYARFQTIPQREVDVALGLSERIFPKEVTPVVTNDGILFTERLFSGLQQTGTKSVRATIARISFENGADILLASHWSAKYRTGNIKSARYTLAIKRNEFYVDRDETRIRDIDPRRETLNPEHLESIAQLRYDVGAMVPEPGDWNTFLHLLRNPPGPKADRLARAFRRLRS